MSADDDYFNSSKLKVIGLITAATVAVGALGGIAGVAFDPEQPSTDNVVQPGTGGARLAPQSLGTPGRAKPGAGTPELARLWAGTAAQGRALPGSDLGSDLGSDSTTLPSPIGTATPGGGGFTSAPQPTDEPTDDTTGSDLGGEGVTLSATDVQVYLPPGWQVDFTDEQRAFLSDGTGNFAFAFTYTDAPSTSAGDVITNNLESLLPGENYTQLQTSDVVPLEPFGAVVSLAGLEYEALWVDNQGSASIHGQVYVAVRQDGTVLGILVEHIPAEDFEDAFDQLVPVLDESFNRFGGLA